MTLKERNKIYKRIHEKFGTKIQLIVSIEEMSELTKELTKTIRGYDRRINIIEEIGDVRIMIEPLELIFDCHDKVDEQMHSELYNPKTENRIYGKDLKDETSYFETFSESKKKTIWKVSNNFISHQF